MENKEIVLISWQTERRTMETAGGQLCHTVMVDLTGGQNGETIQGGENYHINFVIISLFMKYTLFIVKK